MGKIADFVDKNPTLIIGGSGFIILFVGYQLIKKKPAPATSSATTGGVDTGLSGLATDANGNHVVYIPTQTTFSTVNSTAGAFSNDPSLTTISGPIGNTDSPTSTVTKTTTAPTTIIPTPYGQPPIVIPVKQPTTPVTSSPPASSGSAGTGNPPPRAPVPPTVAPPSKGKNLYWDQRYTIGAGENLSSIAAKRTRWLKMSKGFPGVITWNDLYAHNTAVINADSAAHHNPVSGGPWNDVFPTENIVIPDWR